MFYTSKIKDSEKGISQVLIAASKFNADRFIYALQYKNWDESKLELMGKEVATYREKLEVEYNRLVEFAKIFNKEFATENNQCYSSALTMLNKIRSGISETKKLFMKFCPRARQERVSNVLANKPASAYDYSYISANIYQLPLFKFEGYPDCVSGLYNEMEKFFILLMRCIQLCIEVLKEESKIKKDNKYCKFLFEQFKEKIIGEIYDIIMMIPSDSKYLSEEYNSAIASRNHYDNDEAWAPVGFHNYSKSDVKCLIIKQLLDEKKSSDLTCIEIVLFGNDEEKVHKIRNMIIHFDELIPENYRRKNLPAKYIQMFFQYIGISNKLESKAVEYFNEIYLSSPQHRFKTVTYQAVNSHKKEIIIDKDGSFKEFVNNIKRVFYNVVPLKKAANF